MAVVLAAVQTFTVGEATVVQGDSPVGRLAAVFEDDGETGYYYALDAEDGDNPIQDAVHIYNVSSVADRSIPSEIKVVWSQDGQKTALLINDYPHAVFDFSARRGYCRTGFPPSGMKWPQESHAWDDAALQLFQ